jgi:hypothetical protein
MYRIRHPCGSGQVLGTVATCTDTRGLEHGEPSMNLQPEALITVVQ